MRGDLDENAATDILWTVLDAGPHQSLAVDREWGDERFARWLADGLLALLVAGGACPVTATD